VNNVLVQAQILFKFNHDPGYYSVNTFNQTDGHLFLENAFYLNENPNPPFLTGLTPVSGQAGEIAIVTVTGEYTHFMQGYNSVALQFPGGWPNMSASFVTALDNETLEAEFHIPTNAITGIYNLHVFNSWDGNMGYLNAFEVTSDPDPPYLENIVPDNGTIPETLTVTISGVNTHFAQGTGTFVRLKQGSYTTIYPQSTNAVSDTELDATFAFDNLDEPGYYDVRTYSALDDQLYLYNAFYLNPNPNPPQLLSIDPGQAVPGEPLEVTISGQNTSFSQGTGTATWLNKNNAFIYPNMVGIQNDELMTANYYIPSNASTGLYSVNTLNNFDGHLILPDALLIEYLNPQLLLVIPDEGFVGDTVFLEVTGEDTHFLDAASSLGGWMEGPQAIMAMDVTPISNTVAELEFDLSDGFEPGIWTLAVSNNIDGALYLPDAFEVLDTISNVVDHRDLFTLEIAPNPTQDHCYLSFHSAVDGPVFVSLVDRNGNKLDEFQFETSRISRFEIDLKDFPAGMYFLEIHFNGTVSAYKIIRTP
jgi:hypothetical protein